MIVPFLFSWIIYWLLLVLLPLTLLYPNASEALFIQVLFVSLTLTSFIGVSRVLFFHGAGDGVGDIPNGKTLILSGLLLSLMGLSLLVFDKIFIQGIDYSHGLADAREQWRRLGLERQGVSSIFSVAGYLLGSGYFVSLAITIAHPDLLKSIHRNLVYGFCIALCLGNSIITGGRSTLLLLGAFGLAARAIRAPSSASSRVNPTSLVLGTLTLGLVCSYILYVTFERARSNGISVDLYVMHGVNSLGMKLDDWYLRTLDGSFASSVSAALVFAGAYIVHSFSTVAAMVDALPEDKTIVFFYGFQLVSKLGLIAAPDGDWFLAGAFPSLPGAFWHQFGMIGVVLSAVVLGGICAVSEAIYRAAPRSLLALGARIGCCVVLILSPLLFAGDLLAFPFVVIAFVVLSGVQGALSYIRRPATHRANNP